MENKVDLILKESSLKGVADYINSNNVNKIIVLTGAGVSTAAGIPDFRSQDTGLYANLQKYDLPYPEAIFDINYFYERPQPFYILAKEIMPSSELFRPTLSHYFVKLLANRNLLLRNYTQNIDTLERLAGLDENLLVEAHGSFHSGRCIGKTNPKLLKKPPVAFEVRFDSSSDETTSSEDDSESSSSSAHSQLSCGRTFTQAWIKEQVTEKAEQGGIPACPDCGGLVKPDITFFGEQLPERFYSLMQKDFPKADLLIVMGTSLQVAPFKELVHMVGPDVPRLLINLEKVGQAPPKPKPPATRNATKFGRPPLVPQGFDFDNEYLPNNRDVFYKGSTDEGSLFLAKALGWEAELLALQEEGIAQLKAALEQEHKPVVEESVQQVIDQVRDAIRHTHINSNV